MKQQYTGSVNPNSCSIKTPDNSREKTIEAVRAFTTISNMGASLSSDLEGTQSKLNGMYECNAMMDRQITLCAAIARGQAKNQEKICDAWEAMRNAGFHIYNEAELGEAAIAVKNLYEDRDRLGVRCRELVEEADRANGGNLKARETIEAQVTRINNLTDSLETAREELNAVTSLTNALREKLADTSTALDDARADALDWAQKAKSLTEELAKLKAKKTTSIKSKRGSR